MEFAACIKSLPLTRTMPLEQEGSSGVLSHNEVQSPLVKDCIVSLCFGTVVPEVQVELAPAVEACLASVQSLASPEKRQE